MYIRLLNQIIHSFVYFNSDFLNITYTNFYIPDIVIALQMVNFATTAIVLIVIIIWNMKMKDKRQ